MWDMVIAVRLVRYLELGLFARWFLGTTQVSIRNEQRQTFPEAMNMK